MRSVTQRWTPMQLSDWQSLDSSLRSWIADLMWRREGIREIAKREHVPVSTLYDPSYRLDMPSNCQLSGFEAPVHNSTDPEFNRKLRSYFIRTDLPVPASSSDTTHTADAWDRWQHIEPSFKRQVEDEFYEQHYQLLWVRAKAAWWRSHFGVIERCIEAARVQALSITQQATLASQVTEDNKAIDSKWDRVIKTVREQFGPGPVKPEKIEQLNAMKEIDKYTHDMDRSGKASPSPSPHEDILH